MVIGLPNIGKSALINALAKKQATRVQNRPAITQQLQWVMINPHVALLDTPGILMPKIHNPETSYKLALIKCIKDHLFDPLIITRWLIQFITIHHLDRLETRYKITIESLHEEEIIIQIAKSRQCLLPNHEIDFNKVCRLIIGDYRDGKLGRITFDQADKSLIW